MTTERSEHFQRVFEGLVHFGILLESDAKLPSISTLVAGKPVRGSWWAHPRAHTIFQLSRQLATHADATVTKLVSGKVTYVHRRLWPALLAVATSGEPWQMNGLSALAKKLLTMVKRRGQLRTDQTPWPSSKATRELEERLLVHSQEVHTSTGAHAKHLETWERWSTRVNFAGAKMKPEEGKRELEQVLAAINTRFQAEGQLPWTGWLPRYTLSKQSKTH